jgi:hypothetical protein
MYPTRGTCVEMAGDAACSAEQKTTQSVKITVGNTTLQFVTGIGLEIN